jgi:hypothetical protein
MTKRLKVTVTGYINETFVGTEPEVEKFLLELKRRQLEMLAAEDLKLYKSVTFKSKTNHNDNSHLHWRNTEMMNNDYSREKFRDRNKDLGLKIKIEPFTPQNDKFF